MKNGFLDIIKAFRTPRIKGPEETEVLDSVFGEDNGYNRFYSRAGIVYRLTGFVFLFAFLVYLILTTVANLDKITYENAEYIVRNFAERLEDNERESSGMIYDPDGEMRFSLFGKGLAICGNTGVTVFSATGRRTCRNVAEMPDPALKASSKYAVAFGSGGCEYYVYNAFSRVYSGRTERPVYAFSVADNGSYLYITSGEIYESEIVLCDSDFGIRAVYGKNDPAVCAVIDPDGSRFAVITLGLSGTGKYSATLSVYPFASETESFTVALEDVLPLDCVFSEEGITVLCDNCVQRFDGAGRLVCRDFFSGEIVCASLSYGSSAVVTGFGRVARALVPRLRALGTEVTVAAVVVSPVTNSAEPVPAVTVHTTVLANDGVTLAVSVVVPFLFTVLSPVMVALEARKSSFFVTVTFATFGVDSPVRSVVVTVTVVPRPALMMLPVVTAVPFTVAMLLPARTPCCTGVCPHAVAGTAAAMITAPSTAPSHCLRIVLFWFITVFIILFSIFSFVVRTEGLS